MSKRNRHKTEGNKSSALSFPVVDVVIPYHGPADLLKKCLEALPAAAESVPINVVIVDDFFGDGLELQKVVSEIPYHITVLRNKENVGFGLSCNRGASRCGARYLFFLNADAEMLPNSIAIMVDALNQSPDISIVGPKLLFREDRGEVQGRPAGKVQHAGIEINIRGEPFHIFAGWSRDNPKVNQSRIVPAVTGAALMIRREDFKRVDGFDPLWGRGTFEDVDLSMKMASLGKKTLYLAQAEGYHFVGGSNTPYPLQQNMMIFKARWGGSLQWTEWPLW